MQVSKRVIYSGRVQGVGFRYTTQRLAEGLPVAGFVQNQRDGTVLLCAEGEDDSVRKFLERVAQQMGTYIVNALMSDEASQGYRGFVIRH